jgi:outer membrane protein OmpA-like peptidoglycan-associated protein
MSIRPAFLATAVGLALLAAWMPFSATAQAIPVRPGVTLVYATKPADSDLRPDFERLVTVDSLTSDEIVLHDFVSYALKPTDDLITTDFHRTMSRRELQFSRSLFTGGMMDDTSQHRGTSFMMVSSAVLRGLRATGSAGLRVVLWGGREESGTLQRIERDPVMVPVLINGRPDSISTIHVRLDGVDIMDRRDPQYEFWIADDTAHAWLVRDHTIQDGKPGLQDLVRIEWSDSTTTAALTADLRRACRARVSGVFFASGSAKLSPASDPTLTALGAVLKGSPDWQVTIEGHTDSIGGASYNQDLSERRAKAVKAALVDHYHIETGRLTTIGYGLTRPVAPNTTLTGRSRNRRVELVRTCAGGKAS